MKAPKEEAIKVRVPLALKVAIQKLAHKRFTSESEIVREAIISYLKIGPSSGPKKDSPRKGQLDTEHLDKRTAEAFESDRKKPPQT